MAALVTGTLVYYGLGFLLAWMVFDVLRISVSTADAQSLLWMIALKLIPLCGAMVTAIFVVARLRRRPQT